VRVVVVGAGLAGLSCARRLTDAGHRVTVVDKGRSVGGRMATRRIGEATLDTGAQFFTARSDEMRALVDELCAAGAAAEWHRGLGDAADGHPRYRGVPSMNAIAKHLAAPLDDVRCSTMVFSIEPGTVRIDDGTSITADAVVVTSPVWQSVALLLPGGIELPSELVEAGYWPTLALLAVLDGSSSVPMPGIVQDADSTFATVVDNAAKGVSKVPALTMHLRDELSEARWDDDPAAVHADLLAAAQPWFGEAEVVDSQLKRWRFATPKSTWPEPFLAVGDGSIVLAGDAFAGPKVEGAVLSGLAAAQHLLA
jgi:renalase